MIAIDEYPPLKELELPYYVQIYDIIYQMMEEGQLREGDTIPGENILAEHWNVSRGTVRMAVRQLKEDGYIYKMQGRKTTVTGQMEHRGESIQRISNPCLTSCANRITHTETTFNVQSGGRLVGSLLGHTSGPFTAIGIDTKYFVDKQHIASSVAILPILFLEQAGIGLEEHTRIEALALSELHAMADHSHLSISSLEWSPEEELAPQCPVLIIIEEVLYKEGSPFAYYKFRMDGNWYRFTLDRRP